MIQHIEGNGEMEPLSSSVPGVRFPNNPLERQIILLGPITDREVAVVLEGLFTYEAQDPMADVSLYISSPGGDLYGAVAIIDAMEGLICDVRTYGLGMVGSAAAVIFSCGCLGKRTLFQNCQMMLHQSQAGVVGDPSNVMNAAKQIQHIQDRMFEMLGAHSNYDASWWKQRLETEGQDLYLSSEQALEHGVADEVRSHRNLLDLQPRKILTSYPTKTLGLPKTPLLGRYRMEAEEGSKLLEPLREKIRKDLLGPEKGVKEGELEEEDKEE